MSSKHKSCTLDKANSEASYETETSFRTIPYQTKYSAFDETAIHSHKSATIPVIEAKSEKYTPIPYVFRVPDTSNNKTITTMARCPPFHVQLDHAIAVVWSLYASEETEIPLGINQLHWAYSFLENVKDKDSTFPRDVQHCLDSISDELIEQYADLVDDIPTPKSSRFSFNPEANSTKKDVHDEDDNGDDDDKPPCVCNAGSSGNSAVRFADEVDDACSGSSSNEGACSKQPDYPFSVTYNDMKLHNYNLDNQPKKKPECNADNKINSFLNDMRKDQLMKILDELERLNSIENYIGTSNRDFNPYLDEQDQELKDFIAKKLNLCKNDDCESKPKEKKSTSNSSVMCKRDSKERGTQDEKEKSDEEEDREGEEVTDEEEENYEE